MRRHCTEAQGRTEFAEVPESRQESPAQVGLCLLKFDKQIARVQVVLAELFLANECLHPQSTEATKQCHCTAQACHCHSFGPARGRCNSLQSAVPIDSLLPSAAPQTLEPGTKMYQAAALVLTQIPAGGSTDTCSLQNLQAQRSNAARARATSSHGAVRILAEAPVTCRSAVAGP